MTKLKTIQKAVSKKAGGKGAGANPPVGKKSGAGAPRLRAIESQKAEGAGLTGGKAPGKKATGKKALVNQATSEKGSFPPVHKDVIRRFSKEKALELYQKLVRKKAEVQNRPQLSKQALSSLGSERGGEDQADLMSRLQAETQYMAQIQRDSSLIGQVLKALAKMQSGAYGICEQTGEVIEIERLDSIPWTALSIEGAEDLENMERLRKIR